MMEEQLLKLAASNGIWAMLFVVLFLYTIYDSRHRETKYQQTIEKNQKIIQDLSNDIKSDVKDTRGDVSEIKQDVKHLKVMIERKD
jgi:uncharacterized protein YktB (UPF0637 family)